MQAENVRTYLLYALENTDGREERERSMEEREDEVKRARGFRFVIAREERCGEPSEVYRVMGIRRKENFLDYGIHQYVIL